MNIIKQFFSAILKPDRLFTFLNSIIKIILNPIVILFVPIFLNQEVQGYWYTFGSVAALTNLADLGFTSIITQFVAHEYAFLKIDALKGVIDGPAERIERLASLFKFAIRWGSKVMIAAFGIILFAGVAMFSGTEDQVRWFLPWLLYVMGTIFNFATQVGLAFFEGCSQFSITQRIRIVASIGLCVSTIVLLAAGAGLYALGIPILLKGILVVTQLKSKYGRILKQLITKKITTCFAWKKEFIPLFSRYAVSWISGYFATQIYNPLVFAKYGSVAAGKVGYCLSIIQAFYSVAYVWLLVDIPKFSMLEEKKNWNQMDEVLKRDLTFALATFALGVAAMFVIGESPSLQPVLWARLLSKQAVLWLAYANMLNLVINALAVYLRAHKREPFMMLSIMAGALTAGFTILFVSVAGIEFVFAGMALTYTVLVPYAVFVWKRCKKEWH